MATANPNFNPHIARLDTLVCATNASLISAAPSSVTVDGYIHDINLADVSIFESDRAADKSVLQSITYAVKEAGYLAKMVI